VGGLGPLTDAEGMSVGVVDEDFADAPRLVAGRLQDGDSLAIARGVDGSTSATQIDNHAPCSPRPPCPS
jgi:hypothetical protein